MTAGIVVTLSQSSNRLPLHDDLTFLENVLTLQLLLLSHSFSVPTRLPNPTATQFSSQ